MPQMEHLSGIAPAYRDPSYWVRCGLARAAAELRALALLALMAAPFALGPPTASSAGAAPAAWGDTPALVTSAQQEETGTGGLALHGYTLGEALRITDGDSAMAAIAAAVQEQPDHPLAGEALMRAGFIAYVKGDVTQAERFFGMAEEYDLPEASLWRGLSLLAAGRATQAAQLLREMSLEGEGQPKDVAKLALAACSFVEGDIEGGASICREIMEEEGTYSVAATLLLARSVPGAVSPGELEGRASAVAERDPQSYEASLAEQLSEVVLEEYRETAPLEEEVLEDIPTSVDSDREETGGGAGESEEEMESPGGLQGERESVGGAGGASASRRDAGSQTASTDIVFYTVQVGAFADIRNAESLMDRLIEKGYDAVWIGREVKDEVLFHCVRVGRFAERDEAEALAAELERREALESRILRKDAR